MPHPPRASFRPALGVLLVLWACADADDPAAPTPPSLVEVIPGSATFESVGQTRAFTARALDGRGRTLNHPVAWTSSDPAVVVVDSLGVATAVAAGQAEIRATVAGVTGTARAFVTLGLPDARRSLPYAATLQPAQGVPPFLWSLHSGVLPPGIDLRSSGRLEGIPTQEGTFTSTLRVIDGQGASVLREITLRVCPAPLSLPPGGHAVFPAVSAQGCSLLIPAGASGDRWRVALIRPSLSTTAGDTAAARLEVTRLAALPGGGAPAVAAPQPLRALRDGAETFPLPQALLEDPVLQEALRISEHTARVHAQMRIRDARLLQELGPDARPLPSLDGGGMTGVAASASLSPSPSRRTFIPYNNGQCANPPAPRAAVLLGENEHLAIYQDSIQRTTAPVAVSHVQQMLDYYRDFGRPVIDAYFGGVSDVDGNGRVVVFISPVVGQNTAAFVWSGDFFPRTGQGSCAASNEMELIYFNNSVIGGIANGDFQALATLVHEVKHVSSLYKRIRFGLRNGVSSPYHPVWVEEGTAEIAAEMSSRLAWAANGGPPVGARLRRQDFQGASFNAWNYGVLLRLARTVTALASQPNSLTTDPAGAALPDGSTGNHSFYGSSWHFHRFLGDAYGGAQTPLGDSALFRAQNDSFAAPAPGPSGVIPVAGGKTLQVLLEEYAVASLLTGSGAPQPQRRFHTYEFGGGASTSVTEIFCSPNPLGVFPWPVTTTGTPGACGSPGTPEVQNPAAPFQSATFAGFIGPSGIRVHEFVSDGAGFGLEVRGTAGAGGRMVVVRIR